MRQTGHGKIRRTLYLILYFSELETKMDGAEQASIY